MASNTLLLREYSGSIRRHQKVVPKRLHDRDSIYIYIYICFFQLNFLANFAQSLREASEKIVVDLHEKFSPCDYPKKDL